MMMSWDVNTGAAELRTVRLLAQSFRNLARLLQVYVPALLLAGRVLQRKGEDGVALLERVFLVGFAGVESFVDGNKNHRRGEHVFGFDECQLGGSFLPAGGGRGFVDSLARAYLPSLRVMAKSGMKRCGRTVMTGRAGVGEKKEWG